MYSLYSRVYMCGKTLKVDTVWLWYAGGCFVVFVVVCLLCKKNNFT